MPFIKESLADVRERRAAPEGEYDLRIMKATDAPSKKGTDMITVQIGFADGTDAPPFYEYLMGWDSDTPDDQISMRKLTIKRFCAVFDVSEDFDAEDLVGETGNCMVTQEEGQDGMVRNRLKLPRLKD
jgi:hypothetical protein